MPADSSRCNFRQGAWNRVRTRDHDGFKAHEVDAVTLSCADSRDVGSISGLMAQLAPFILAEPGADTEPFMLQEL